jgi:hypothetical protein
VEGEEGYAYRETQECCEGVLRGRKSEENRDEMVSSVQ